MNIQIRSAKEAAHEIRIRPNYWSVVSLRTPGDEESYRAIDQLAHLTDRIIIREFDDVWEPDDKKVMPTKEDIQAVLNFVINKRSMDFLREQESNILVHCHAGVSRSAAMAYILACTENEPEEAVKMLNPMLHVPNELMVRLGAEILDNPKIFDVCKEALGGDPFASMMG